MSIATPNAWSPLLLIVKVRSWESPTTTPPKSKNVLFTASVTPIGACHQLRPRRGPVCAVAGPTNVNTKRRTTPPLNNAWPLRLVLLMTPTFLTCGARLRHPLLFATLPLFPVASSWSAPNAHPLRGTAPNETVHIHSKPQEGPCPLQRMVMQRPPITDPQVSRARGLDQQQLDPRIVHDERATE